ncbi:MAG: hypothetical protein ACK559_00075, partial [bacterium]
MADDAALLEDLPTAHGITAEIDRGLKSCKNLFAGLGPDRGEGAARERRDVRRAVRAERLDVRRGKIRGWHHSPLDRM